jgi:nicotinate-nucleotide--dimethylbenzimidazole phosphoribosyltransferase
MWTSLLVLGGTGSGKEDVAEALVADAPGVRYATALDAEREIAEAKPDETLLVHDLAARVAAGRPAGALAEAVSRCAARLVLVSSEVGLAPVPADDRGYAEALGALNRAVAQACDAVVLVVAGQTTWLKAGRAQQVRRAAPEVPVIQPGMELPMPDVPTISERPELGELARVVAFAAGTGGRPWRAPRVLLIHGEHAGGASAGAVPRSMNALQALAARAGATVQRVDAPPARAMEREAALHPGEVDEALRHGWRVAAAAADDGVEVLVIGSSGPGADAAATAVVAALTRAEAPALLPRTVTPGGHIDDLAWMLRCTAIRDALYRIRPAHRQPRDIVADHTFARMAAATRATTTRAPLGGIDVLGELGGGDVAVATGVLLGAAARRTPVLVDGPVGVAAALAAREIAAAAPRWCLLPDHGRNPVVRHAAAALGLVPFTDLGLGLGEGATALATLPLCAAALSLSGPGTAGG